MAKCFLFFLLLCCLSHSLPQFRHIFLPKFWAESAWPKFGLAEKIPSPRDLLPVDERDWPSAAADVPPAAVNGPPAVVPRWGRPRRHKDPPGTANKK